MYESVVQVELLVERSMRNSLASDEWLVHVSRVSAGLIDLADKPLGALKKAALDFRYEDNNPYPTSVPSVPIEPEAVVTYTMPLATVGTPNRVPNDCATPPARLSREKLVLEL